MTHLQMTSNIKATKIRCPHCRAAMARTFLHQGIERLCPFCGTSFVASAENMSTTEAESPDRVVPFRATRKDFEREILKCLAADDRTPGGLFDDISSKFKNVEGCYYPAYMFEGRYTVVLPDVYTENNKNEKRGILGFRKDTKGSTETIPFIIICPAGEGPEMLPELNRLIRDVGFDPDKTKPYSGKLFDQCCFIQSGIGKETAWEQYASQSIRAEAEKQFETDNIPSISLDIEEKHNGRLIYIPFWLSTFEHGGHIYRFIMDGTDPTSLHEYLPPIPAYEKPHRILRKIANTLLVLAWISLLALFWNVLWIPGIFWSAWIIFYLILHIQRLVIRHRNTLKRPFMKSGKQ